MFMPAVSFKERALATIRPKNEQNMNIVDTHQINEKRTNSTNIFSTKKEGLKRIGLSSPAKNINFHKNYSAAKNSDLE